jgi:hypothetical protein
MKRGIALQGWGVGAVQGVRAARWGRGGLTQSPPNRRGWWALGVE